MPADDTGELTPALPLTGPDGVSVVDAIELLTRGDLGIEGRVMDASNATFYCGVVLGGRRAGCVYKPVAGERPLWDFPDGTLAEREVAAYEVSAAAGWGIVPPTVYRDGPAGPGMVQLWVDVDDTIVESAFPVVIEVPKGSKNKYELDKETGLLRLDRRGAIEFRPSISTHEVRRAVRSEDFDRLASTFDDVVYGGREPLADDVQEARERWPAVVK